MAITTSALVSGLVGGLVATIVMTVVMMVAGDDTVMAARSRRRRRAFQFAPPISPVTDDGSTHRCEACGKEFDSEEALHDHMREAGLVE